MLLDQASGTESICLAHLKSQEKVIGSLSDYLWSAPDNILLQNCEAKSILAGALDSIHGFISVLDELGNVFAVVGIKRDSDTRANSRLLVITQDDRLRYAADYLFGNLCRII